MSYRDHLPQTSGYSRLAIGVNAVVALAVTALVLWWASGFGPFYEQLFRVAPVADGANAGVGADWTAGNQIAWLDFLIALTHAADVIMGVFILFMVFLHWGAFRRLAARMEGGESAGGRSDSSSLSTDGGRDRDGRARGARGDRGEDG